MFTLLFCKKTDWQRITIYVSQRVNQLINKTLFTGSKPIPTKSSTPLLIHDQTARRLELARSVALQVANKLTRIQQCNLLNQQQIREAEDRIDQLLANLKQSSLQSGGQIDQNTDHGLVANHKRPDGVEQLRHQLRQRSELLRQSAHDLKSNFSLIQGATDLLVRARTDTDRQHMLGMLQRNFRQATRLLTQLLDVTRLEAGEERQQLTTFNVVDLLSGLVEYVQPLADEKGLWMRKQGLSSLLIEGDSVKLYRIVQNLVLNAITHTKAGGVTLNLESETGSQEWCLTVTDTGPGLSTGSHHASGEGIGLLIVRQLCALLEGQLFTEELQNVGTQFRISFPLRYSNRFTTVDE